MTKVDNYLEKYLDGSISERELQQFRDLLEEEPQLRTELSQTLELRSIIHDDLLALTPPDHLSEFVRENLAEQFAALAAEEEEERRPVIFTSRFAGSSLAAMVALVLIALAPTLIAPSGGDSLADLPGGRNDGIAQTLGDRVGGGSEGISVAGPDISGEATPIAPATRIPDNADVAESSLATLRVQRNTRPANPRNTVRSDEQILTSPVSTDPALAAVLGEEETERIYVRKHEENATVPDSRLGGADNSGAVAHVEAETPDNEADALAAVTSTSLPFGNRLNSSLEFMANDPEDMLQDIVSTSRMLDKMETASRPIEERFGQTDMEASARSRSGRSVPDLDRNESHRRRIMFGGTLASGLTTKESTFSVQGSAYLAMTLGEENRIGLEGGSAMFSYRRVVSVQTKPATPQGFARRSTDPGDLQGSATGGRSGDNFRAGGMGGSSGGTGTNNGGTTIDQTLPGGGTGHSGEPVASREWKSPQILGGENSAYQPIGREGDPQYDYQALETEASMVYGLIFYDHTVTSVNKMLKINGRIGVGGADGGIVLNARAYAAISTHENVAWTLGVGGAMLHGFSDDIDFNANYGVNAGVELGF